MTTTSLKNFPLSFLKYISIAIFHIILWFFCFIICFLSTDLLLITIKPVEEPSTSFFDVCYQSLNPNDDDYNRIAIGNAYELNRSDKPIIACPEFNNSEGARHYYTLQNSGNWISRIMSNDSQEWKLQFTSSSDNYVTYYRIENDSNGRPQFIPIGQKAYGGRFGFIAPLFWGFCLSFLLHYSVYKLVKWRVIRYKSLKR